MKVRAPHSHSLKLSGVFQVVYARHISQKEKRDTSYKTHSWYTSHNTTITTPHSPSEHGHIIDQTITRRPYTYPADACCQLIKAYQRLVPPSTPPVRFTLSHDMCEYAHCAWRVRGGLPCALMAEACLRPAGGKVKPLWTARMPGRIISASNHTNK